MISSIAGMTGTANSARVIFIRVLGLARLRPSRSLLMLALDTALRRAGPDDYSSRLVTGSFQLWGNSILALTPCSANRYKSSLPLTSCNGLFSQN